MRRLGAACLRLIDAGFASTCLTRACSALRLSSTHRPPHRLFSASSAQPITAEEFAAALSRLRVPDTARLAVALSGGCDSTALTLLAHEWASVRPDTAAAIIALQVDHQLRPESAAELQQSALWLKERGIDRAALRIDWARIPPKNQLQQLARDARYAQLLAACGRLSRSHLLLGHHLHDQLETILHRFTRASGVHGLAGISACTPAAAVFAEAAETGVLLCRPLLSWGKERLRATCLRFGVHWLEDPSNANTAFERVRIRQAMDSLGAVTAASAAAVEDAPSAPLPLSQLLSRLPHALQSSQQSVQAVTSRILRQHATFVPTFSLCFLSAAAFRLHGEELMTVVLSRILAVVRGSAVLPGHQLMLDAVRRIRSGQSRQALLPLFGCLLSPLPVSFSATAPPASCFLITRASDSRRTVHLFPHLSPQRVEWDSRFVLHCRYLLPPPPPDRASLPAYYLRSLQAPRDVARLGDRRLGLRHLADHQLPALMRRRSDASSVSSSSVSAAAEGADELRDAARLYWRCSLSSTHRRMLAERCTEDQFVSSFCQQERHQQRSEEAASSRSSAPASSQGADRLMQRRLEQLTLDLLLQRREGDTALRRKHRGGEDGDDEEEFVSLPHLPAGVPGTVRKTQSAWEVRVERLQRAAAWDWTRQEPDTL